MARSAQSRIARSLLVLLLAVTTASPARAASPEEIEQKLKALEEQVGALRQQLEETRKAATAATPAPAPATATPPPPASAPATAASSAAPAPAPGPTAAPPPVAPVSPVGVTAETLGTLRPSWLSDFKLGGYGSLRFEGSDLPSVGDSFTYRRFVLTGDATIADRLRGYFELELERFTELELEKKTVSEGGSQGFSSAIEGSNGSEISLEQAWVEFIIADWLKFRAGNILVPVGRFNLNHDDNRWDLPRRPLVDRGVPVLPTTAAWSEVGLGFDGELKTDSLGKFTYEIYVMNGVALDSTVETFARGSGELEAEVEIEPRRGTANLDVKREKAFAARLGWSPSIGTDFGVSGYFGRYTPDFLPAENLWSVSADGKMTFGPFEIEAEYVHTHFGGITRVARGFAQSVLANEISSGTEPLESTIDFELAGLADTKQGYWLDLRYRFFPDFLRNTFLAWKFANPQFIVTTRWEQVWLDGLVTQAVFSDGALASLSQESRFVNRLTLGFAYRPVPLVVFQTAFERTWTNNGKSLASVTNFIPAGTSENIQNAFLFGVAFGF